MSNKKKPDMPITYTVNLSDTNYGNFEISWNDYNWFTSDGTQSGFIQFGRAEAEYDKMDAEFDAMEDQTSIAKAMLNDIGIKC